MTLLVSVFQFQLMNVNLYQIILILTVYYRIKTAQIYLSQSVEFMIMGALILFQVINTYRSQTIQLQAFFLTKGMLQKNNPMYDYLVCLSCTNVLFTEQIDNWRIRSCELFHEWRFYNHLQYSQSTEIQISTRSIYSNYDSPCTVTCSFHAVNDCGGALLTAPTGLTFSTTFPWKIYASTTDVLGFQTIPFCIRCSSAEDSQDQDYYQVTVCGRLTPGSLTDVHLGYSDAEDNLLNFDIDQLFDNTQICPISFCYLRSQGCLAQFSWSYDDVSLIGDPPTGIKVFRDNLAGFHYTVCLWCTNSQGNTYYSTETEVTIDNWKISQCGKLSPGVLTAEFGYVENGADAQIIFDPDSIFQNSDTVCPIISCSYHSAGDCGGVVLEDLIDVVLPLNSQPWSDIYASQTKIVGYKFNLCIRCTNGYQSQDTDNLVISQCGRISPGTMPDFIHGFEEGAPNVEIPLDINTLLDSQDFMNCPLTCTILEQGCTDPFLGSFADISFVNSPPTSVSVAKTNMVGFHYTICMSCTNGFQTVGVNNWRISQCGKLSSGILSNVEIGYIENAADLQISFDPDTIFQNSDTACPITPCTIHAAFDCGGSVLDEFIGLVLPTSSQPWTDIYISQSTILGYKYSICFRCSNGYQIKDIDNLVLSQCGRILPGTMPDFIHGFDQGAPNVEIPLDINTLLDNQDFMNCPLTCTILEAGCADPFLGSLADISFVNSPPTSVSVSKTSVIGFHYKTCISCTNGFQTVGIDNWRISQCGKLHDATIEDKMIQYEEEGQDEIVKINAWSTLQYNDFNCPILSCSMYLADECGVTLISSPLLRISASSPWDITASKTSICAYKFSLCVQCTNGFQTASINMKISQTCSTMIRLSDFSHYQAAATYSNEAQQFVFPPFKQGCNEKIAYEIRSSEKSRAIPSGLFPEVYEETGKFVIYSLPQLSSTIEFYIHTSAQGALDKVFGPFVLIHTCQMSSKPTLQKGVMFTENQAVQIQTAQTKVAFSFSSFRSQCGNVEFPPIVYKISKNNIIMEEHDEFLNDAEEVSPGKYEIILKNNLPGLYSGFLVATQGLTEVYEPFQLQVEVASQEILDQIIQNIESQEGDLSPTKAFQGQEIQHDKELNIQSKAINHKGIVEVVFNTEMQTSDQIKQMINNQSLNISIIDSKAKQSPSNLSQSSQKPLTWKVLSFRGNTLQIEVTFDRPKMISPLIDQDSLAINITDSKMFKAYDPSYSSLKTRYILIPLRRQMANSDFTDGFETMSEQTSNLLFGPSYCLCIDQYSIKRIREIHVAFNQDPSTCSSLANGKGALPSKLHYVCVPCDRSGYV